MGFLRFNEQGLAPCCPSESRPLLRLYWQRSLSALVDPVRRTPLAAHAVAIALLVGAAPAASDVTFSDGEFDPGDWETSVVYTQGKGGTASAAQHSGDGNPGSHWRSRHVIDGGSNPQSQIYVLHLGLRHAYDPSVQGGIEYLDVGIDSRTFIDTHLGQGQSTSICALRQNGVVYRSIPGVVAGNPDTAWIAHEQLGLTAVNFQDVTGASGNPDFSAQGSIMEFGFVTANGFGTDGEIRTTEVGYDNWFVEIVTEVTAVPSSTAQPPLLDQPAPNPTTGAVHFSLSMPTAVHVTTRVFDAAGRVVATLVEGEMAAGSHSLEWIPGETDGKRLASGAYYIRAEAADRAETRSVVVIR